MLLTKSVPASTMLATSMALMAGAASAQNAPPKETASFEIEEIVVTALKYDSVLQRTPLAITVVSGDTLEKRGVDNLTDLVRTTPGLALVDQGTGQRRLIVRGVVSGGEAQTGQYYDETPIPGAPSTTNDAGQRMPDARLFDVERIEVLRGPQGTLYGAGSMGGTVRALFNKPTSEFSTQLSAGTRTSEEGELGYEANAMVNVPLVSDTLALRAVGYHVDRGGYIDNVTLKQEDVDDDEISGGRVLMRYTPTDTLTIDAAVHIQREDALVSVWELGGKDYETRVPTQQLAADDFELYNLTLKWDLGFATLTGVTSQFNRDLDVTIDTTRFLTGLNPLLAVFTPAALHQPQEIEVRTHELRLSSGDQGGPFIWTIGAFFEQRDAFTFSRQFKHSAVTGLPLDPAQLHFERTIDDSLEQRAAFGEITYRFTDSLALTVGGRYFDYEKSAVTATTKAFPQLGIGLSPPTKFEFDEDGFVSKVNVSYRLSESAMVYAQANEGFRPGGANQTLSLPVVLPPYESDSLWNYELGLKSSLFGDRMTLNLSAFRIDWDNMQVTSTTANGAVTFITNASSAQIDGVELETFALVSPDFDVSFAAAYTDARLSENVTALLPVVLAPGREGDRIPNVPKFSASLAAEYRHPLGASLQGSVRADVSYVGATFSELRPNNPFYEEIDAHTLTNLRLRIASQASNWNADLFVNNVLDEVAIGRVLSGPFGKGLAFSSPPRTVGINLTKKF